MSASYLVKVAKEIRPAGQLRPIARFYSHVELLQYLKIGVVSVAAFVCWYG